MQLIHELSMLNLASAVRVDVFTMKSNPPSTAIAVCYGEDTETIMIASGLVPHTPALQRVLLLEIGKYMGTDLTFEVGTDLRLTSIHKVTLTDMRLSIRARKVCSRLGITTPDQFAAVSVDELMACRNVGIATVREIRQKLAAIGLTLRDDPVMEVAAGT